MFVFLSQHIARDFETSQSLLDTPSQVCSIASCGPGFRLLTVKPLTHVASKWPSNHCMGLQEIPGSYYRSTALATCGIPWDHSIKNCKYCLLERHCKNSVLTVRKYQNMFVSDIVLRPVGLPFEDLAYNSR